MLVGRSVRSSVVQVEDVKYVRETTSFSYSEATLVTNPERTASYCPLFSIIKGTSRSRRVGNQIRVLRWRCEVLVEVSYVPGDLQQFILSASSFETTDAYFRMICGKVLTPVKQSFVDNVSNSMCVQLESFTRGPLCYQDGVYPFNVLDDQVLSVPVRAPAYVSIVEPLVYNPAIVAGQFDTGNLAIVAGQFDMGAPVPTPAVAAAAMFAPSAAVGANGLITTVNEVGTVSNVRSVSGSFMLDIFPESDHLYGYDVIADEQTVSDALMLSFGVNAVVPNDCVAGIGNGVFSVTLTVYSLVEFDDTRGNKRFKKN